MITTYTFNIRNNSYPKICVPALNESEDEVKIKVIEKGYDVIDKELDNMIFEVNKMLQPK